MTMLNPSTAYLATQFLLTSMPPASTVFADWPMRTFGGLRLHSHPALPVNTTSTDFVRVIGLGTFLDPHASTRDDAEIVRSLVEDTASFADIEAATFHLGGRWVLLVEIGGEYRVYLDATGSKPVYYVHDSKGRLHAGSTPQTLAEAGLTSHDAQLARTMAAGRHAGNWPINMVPFDGVRQLIPNHYLDCRRGGQVRHWPIRDIPERDPADAAKRMGGILRGVMTAAMHRRACVLSLTAGYDSRLLLAAARHALDELTFFTILRHDSPPHDQIVPKRIARHLGLQHSMISFTAADRWAAKHCDGFADVLAANVGWMNIDPSRRAIAAYVQAVDNRLHLAGNVSEVHRAYYDPEGCAPAALNARWLAERTGYSGNTMAEPGFQAWLDDLPNVAGLAPLDLLYWEHRLGVGEAVSCSFREAVAHRINPMNCRAYLALGLETPAVERRPPYPLIRRMIADMWPELLCFPFNTHWLDGVAEHAARLPLPWRIKMKLRLVS